MKVFYNKNQTVENNDCFSPSAGKPRKVVESWTEKFDIEIVDFEPLTREDFYLAHDKKYIDDLLDGKIQNGFGNTSMDVAKSLPYTAGSLVSATLHALKTGETVASPTSGFHHAGYSHGGGFCSTNALIIAAQRAKQEGAAYVGILDCDQHYPDGCWDIISELVLDYIRVWSLGGSAVGPSNADYWLKTFRELIIEEFDGCSVIIYQAGADPHIDDPLGGRLTTAQLRERDRIVFETAQEMGIPVAWNLAGGYQSPIEKVIDIHNSTAIECVRVEKERAA